jgi:adenylate cyclase
VSTVDALIEWLIAGAPGVTDAKSVIERFGERLRASGLPLDRISSFTTTLHPSVAGRARRWSTDHPLFEGEASHALFASATFVNSPVKVAAEGTEVRLRIGKGPRSDTYAIIDDLIAAGFTDYLALPLGFMGGGTHAISFATKAPDGFSDADVHDLRRSTLPLARVFEIFELRRTASTLLSTYVGRNSGDRILAGHIQRGHFETVRAVIWFSDLRGFTEMSSRASTREVIDTLNGVFECQVPAVEKHGGEVLKFMGDGMLAIFPLTGDDPSAVGDAALAAADEALAAMALLAPLRIGLALHVGDLAYGNIGGANRLDFTAIGAAVNIASRLEGLTSKLQRPLVLSEDFARLTTRPTAEVGSFELKGVPAPVRVFVPSE